MTTAKAQAAQCRQATAAIIKLASKTAMSCSQAAAIVSTETEDNDRCYNLVYNALVSGFHDITKTIDYASCVEDAECCAIDVAANYGDSVLLQGLVKKLMTEAYVEYNKFDIAV